MGGRADVVACVDAVAVGREGGDEVGHVAIAEAGVCAGDITARVAEGVVVSAVGVDEGDLLDPGVCERLGREEESCEEEFCGEFGRHDG